MMWRSLRNVESVEAAEVEACLHSIRLASEWTRQLSVTTVGKVSGFFSHVFHIFRLFSYYSKNTVNDTEKVWHRNRLGFHTVCFRIG
jgi:hypothetical protein